MNKKRIWMKVFPVFLISLMVLSFSQIRPQKYWEEKEASFVMPVETYLPEVKDEIEKAGMWTASVIPDEKGIVYVNRNIASEGNGSSWEYAVKELADVLKEAETNPYIKEIWVATGTYTPLYPAGDGTSQRDKAFVLPAGVGIYGGFTGNETFRSERDAKVNEVILSGVASHTGTAADHVFHVVIAAGKLHGTFLDGITISGGRADSTSYIMVNNMGINRGCGGGIYLYQSDIALFNVVITGNASATFGGGIYLNNSNPEMEYVLIHGNTARLGGGGIYCNASSPKMKSVSIRDEIYVNRQLAWK